MKIYIVGYYGNSYDSSNEILSAYRNKEEAINKVKELTYEANDIDDKIMNSDAEESQKLWNDYMEKYSMPPEDIVFYFAETELI